MSHRVFTQKDKRNSLSPLKRNESGEVSNDDTKMFRPSTNTHVIGAPTMFALSSHRLSTSLLTKNLSKLGLSSPAGYPPRNSWLARTQTTAEETISASRTFNCGQQGEKSTVQTNKSDSLPESGNNLNHSANRTCSNNSFINFKQGN